MRILLVDPLCKNSKYESPNIKLAYAISVLEKIGVEVKIVDFVFNDIDEISLEDYLLKRTSFINKFQKYDGEYNYIYINCEYGMLNNCIQIAKKIKKAIIIVGGTYINYLYAGRIISDRNNKMFDVFDYFSMGDIELDIAYIASNKLQKTRKTGILNSGMVMNLDEIPFPDWSKFDVAKYDGKLYVVGSKGCSYNKCTFCDEKLIWGDKFRCRNPLKIVQEIKRNKEEYNISDYFFWDASITSYPYLEDLCNYLSFPEYQCSWTALARVKEISEKRLELLKKAGCKTIELGIESLQNSTLATMNKGITFDEIKEKIQLVKDYGIFVEGSFLIGYPDESISQMQDTVEKALGLNLDFYRWHNFQMYSSYIRKYPDMIDDREWFDVDMNYPNHLLSKMIQNQRVAFLEMHMASRIMTYHSDIVPNMMIGKSNMRDIYKITYEAIKQTEKNMVGHNPYI